MYKLFNPINSQRTQRGGIEVETLNDPEVTNFNVENFVNEHLNPTNFPRNLRNDINSLRLADIKKLFLHSIDVITNQSESLSTFEKHVYFTIKDLGYFVISRNFKPKEKNSSPNFMVIKFVNKIIEKVNISKILKEENVKSKLEVSESIRIPNISLKYSNSIRSMITNYKETVQSNTNHEDLSCECTNSPFNDINHNHILTGDLNIVKNVELRNLLKNGLNYREQQPPSKRKALKAFSEGINQYIDTVSNKLKKTLSFFAEWRNVVLDKVKRRISKIQLGDFNNVLSKPDVKSYLTELHRKYVFVPVDKAGNNVAIICKKFYLEVLSNEVRNTPTFSSYNSSEEEIINAHVNVIPNDFNIKIHEDNKAIPYLYWLPKFHKEVVGFRFITAGTKCTTKSLSVNIGLALKSCLKVIQNQSNYDNFYKDMNDYYIIDKTLTVSEFLVSNNHHRTKRSISSYDFQTLYTHIPHHQLKNNLKKFINRAFDIKGKDFICITKKAAFFSTKSHNNLCCFTKNGLVSALIYLVDNSFIIFNGSVYRQVIGIPMGTNSAPYMANIYLAEYEHQFIKKLERSNKSKELKLLKNIFRFQDDLLVLNDDGYFNTIFEEIYPVEMVLKKTNLSPQKVNFLDVTISIYQGKFKYECYDKRNDFNFNVISFPFMSGNLPQTQMHGLFISQLVRYCCTNSTFNSFLKCSNKLYKKLVTQGFQPERLQKNFIAFCQQNINLWSKYGQDLFLSKDRVCTMN